MVVYIVASLNISEVNFGQRLFAESGFPFGTSLQLLSTFFGLKKLFEFLLRAIVYPNIRKLFSTLKNLPANNIFIKREIFLDQN